VQFFDYSPAGERVREWGTDGEVAFFGTLERRYTPAANDKLYVGSNTLITQSGSSRVVTYMLTDRLGSVDAIANSAGNLIETRGFDAFGKPRTGTWGDATPPRLTSTATTRHGFTGHEHLDSLQLIHMNGRVYDYNLGRFMEVDPVVQFPMNSQSLNPYSYLLNNPLSGTDPTGYMMCSGPKWVCFYLQLNEMSNNGKGNIAVGFSEIKQQLGLTEGGAPAGGFNGAFQNDHKTISLSELLTPSHRENIATQDSVEVVGSDINTPRNEIQSESKTFTVSESPLNAERGYDTIDDAAVAQYKAYEPQYKDTVTRGSETYGRELTGLVFKKGDRFYFTDMGGVPAQYKGTLLLLGIHKEDVVAATHTHPDAASFSGQDFVTPAAGLPFFVRTTQGEAYRWDPPDAKKYERYVASLQRSGSTRSFDTQIDRAQWGIRSVCGEHPCLEKY
jgi:RHS repeat-associated protein